MLLKYRAKIDTAGGWNYSPLLWAISAEEPILVEFLLSNNANPNFKGNIYPLTAATLLIEDIDDDDEYKKVEKASGEIIELLLKYGADINVIDQGNKTPYEFAKSVGNQTAIKIFERELRKQRKL